MLLTVSTTHVPATDLGYLLHKHPGRVQQFRQSFGSATVLYPEASDERCTAAVLLEIDPVRLARTRGKGTLDFTLGQYVNDRSYAASSLLGVAVADVFSTARTGRCDARPDLAAASIPLEIEIPALPCRGGADIAERLFGPLGWIVEASPIPLDERFPTWGDSRYLHLGLTGQLRLADALNQLHVLLPVLDEAKHYWQGPDEVEKLLRSGEGWLATHPEADLITRRYLGHQSSLTRSALARLAELGDDIEDACDSTAEEEVAQPVARRQPLNAQRHDAVHGVLLELGARSVVDLGCGLGAFLERLSRTAEFTRIAGSDVSTRSLEQAARRRHVDRMSERQSERIELFHSALTYEDDRFVGFDAAVLMEVIEHVDPPRLATLEHVVFRAANPGAVVVTTPNSEYNALYDGMVGMRHPDHRFEWTRQEFQAWCDRVADTYGYTVAIRGIGELDQALGTPTQMGIFKRQERSHG